MRMQVIAGETIFAASTAPGRSAIAVVRVSGPGALEAVFRTCGVRPLPRVATLSSFKDPVDGQLIDRILVLWFPGPRSFTGDDCAEFHVHGGRAVLRAVLRVLGEVPNFRLARAGEFTRRGFVNGKLDLVEVDGLADVIAADTEMQLRQAQAVAGGHLSSRVSSWRSNLISAQALLEANIDFSDEADVPSQFDSEVISLVKCVLDEMRLLLAEFKRGEIVREGFVVVIVGAPNSGKSSLLNAIARRDVAIVSAEPGTTRDLIEVSVDLDGIAVVLVDTAGLREIAAGVESEGIRRARLRAVTADLALWVSDHENPSFAPEGLIDSGQVLFCSE